MVREIGALLYERKGVPINIDGLAAVLLLDMGFDPHAGRLFIIVEDCPTSPGSTARAALHPKQIHRAGNPPRSRLRPNSRSWPASSMVRSTKTQGDI